MSISFFVLGVYSCQNRDSVEKGRRQKSVGKEFSRRNVVSPKDLSPNRRFLAHSYRRNVHHRIYIAETSIAEMSITEYTSPKRPSPNWRRRNVHHGIFLSCRRKRPSPKRRVHRRKGFRRKILSPKRPPAINPVAETSIAETASPKQHRRKVLSPNRPSPKPRRRIRVAETS